MKVVDRYIAKTVLAAIALVTLMLAGLQIFILFVNQLSDLGRGNFDGVQAAIYVVLQMPYQVYQFFPIASLLGCLIGLGIMAHNHELVVMRAAGMSISQITSAVLKAAMLLIIIITLFGETLVPRLAHFGSERRVQALSKGQVLQTSHGLWFRYDNDFIIIADIVAEDILKNVQQFHFDAAHRLRLTRKIELLKFENGNWQAYNIRETKIDNSQTEVQNIKKMNWNIKIKPFLIRAGNLDPDEMSLSALMQYQKVQKQNHQSALNYQLAFWQRVIQPLTTLVMMILAIPFIFGPLRTATMGSRLLSGAVVGFSFHILNRFFGATGQVLQYPPLLAALTPPLLFAVLGVYLMRRMR